MIRLLLLLSLTILVPACAHQALVPIPEDVDGILVVVNDPRPERLRSSGYGQRYSPSIAYDQDPTLRDYARRIASDYGQTVISEWPLRSLAVHCFVIRKPQESVLRAMEQDSRIRWIQPFNQHELQSVATITGLQNAPVSGGDATVHGRASGVKISIVDTGADLSHRDLPRAIQYEDFAESYGDGSEELHGTSVLGLLAANPSDENGLVHGFASEATIQHLRGCWEESGRGRCNTLTLALALDAAIEFEPAIINLSLSGPKDRLLDELIVELAKTGTVVVSAYDERRSFENRFPSPADNVVFAVAGARFAPHQEHAQTFWAPGEAMSLSPMDDYALVTGHSVAAPYLTGTLARLHGQSAESDGAALIRLLGKTTE